MAASVNGDGQKIPAVIPKIRREKRKLEERCSQVGCDKILSLAEKVIECRCKMHFCLKHRDVVAHDCQVKEELKQDSKKSRHLFESSMRDGSVY